MGFTPADSTMYLRFKYTNPRGVRVTVLETSYSVMLNGVALTSARPTSSCPCSRRESSATGVADNLFIQ